jgi:ribosomal protein L7Ae-like RNA K-turn-binding protein
MRARKIILGEEFVLKSMAKSNAMVFIASDSGDNITKKINDKAAFYSCVVVDSFTTDELSKAIGKQNRKVLLLEDKGFIKKINEYINA